MADNWQLEDKINEVVHNHNQLLQAVHMLLAGIEQNSKLARTIDTISVRVHLQNVSLIALLDLSPRNIEAHQPRLIMYEPRTKEKE
jgi:hypothetical protein